MHGEQLMPAVLALIGFPWPGMPMVHAFDAPRVEVYRLKMPDGRADVLQASDLCWGQLGRHEGLWIVCDRHAGPCGNQVLLIDRHRLAALPPGGQAVVTRTFPVVGPREGWEAFASRHSRLAPEVLAGLRAQFDNFANNQEPILDLEAIAIAPSAAGQPTPTSPAGRTPAPTLFAVTEQPRSFVLELAMIEDDRPGRFELRECFLYAERPEDRGGDANDGIEAIAWAGRPGLFFLAEEGTRPTRAGDAMHFFDAPRLMRAALADGRCTIDEPWSQQATASVRQQHAPPSQTLNALAPADDRTLLAVDRNGGWILAVDAATGRTRRWLNLYGPDGLDLRRVLADVPAPRRMPYVSIEGLARDDRGNLWLVDDPAMPETFRASCLIRVTHPPPLPEP